VTLAGIVCPVKRALTCRSDPLKVQTGILLYSARVVVPDNAVGRAMRLELILAKLCHEEVEAVLKDERHQYNDDLQESSFNFNLHRY
jgi:hypothetical protein